MNSTLNIQESDAPVMGGVFDSVNTKIDGFNDSLKVIKKQQEVESSTLSETAGAVMDTWRSTYVSRTYDYLTNDAAYMFSGVDEQWQEENSGLVIGERLNKLGVKPKFFQQFSESKNESHFKAIQNRVMSQQSSEDNIASTLNSYGGMLSERTIATIATNLLDVDVLTSGSMAIATKIKTLNKLMVQNHKAAASLAVGTQVAASRIAFETDPSVSKGEAVFFATLGSAIDVGQLKYYSHKNPIVDDSTFNDVSSVKKSDYYRSNHKKSMDRIRSNGSDDIEYSEYVDGIVNSFEAGAIDEATKNKLISGLSNKKTMDRTRVKIKGKVDSEGMVKFPFSKKKLSIAGLVALGFPVVLEGDEFGITTDGLGWLALAAGLGLLGAKSAHRAYGAVKTGKAYSDMKRFFGGEYDKLRTMNYGTFSSKDNFKPVELDGLRSALFETTQPLRDSIKSVNPVLKEATLDLINSIFFDTLSGKYLSVEMNKSRIVNSFKNKVLHTIGSTHKEWSKQFGLLDGKKFDNELGYITDSRLRFEHIVFEHMAGIKISDDEFIIKASNQVQTIVTSIKKELSEAKALFIKSQSEDLAVLKQKSLGAKGKDKKHIDESIAELEIRIKDAMELQLPTNPINKNKIGVLYRSLSEGSVEKFVSNLAAVFRIYPEDAKAMLDALSSDRGTSTFKKSNGVVVNIDAMVPDFKSFETIDGIYTNLDGSEFEMTLNHIFTTAPTERMSSSLSSVAGDIALLDAGWTRTGIDELIKLLKKERVEETTLKAIEDAVSIIIGKTLIDQSSPFAMWRKDVVNLTLAFTMGLSVLSQMPEALRMIGQTNLGKMNQLVSRVSDLVGSYKHKGILNELLDDMGVGRDTKSLTFGQFDLLDATNETVLTNRSNISDVASRTLSAAKDANLFLMSLSNDFLVRLAMMKNLEALSDIINGNTKLSADRLGIFGINLVNSAMLKKKGLGNLSKMDKLDLKNWSREDRLEFYKILQNMLMKDVMNTTMGNSPQWFRNTDLGVAMSLLMNFTIGSVANQGLYSIRGIFNGDKLIVGKENAGIFIGGYAAAMARDAIKGNDTDEHDKYLIYATMGLGIAAAPEAIKSLADPAFFSVTGDVADAVQKLTTP